MALILAYILTFNVIAIPIVIYTHAKGECTLLTSVFSSSQALCSYISNPFSNLLYINLFFFVIAILLYANSKIPHSQGYTKKPYPDDTRKRKY